MKTCNTSVKTRTVTVLSTRDYCGGHVYADGRLERTLQPWGYTGADGADYFYINDYLGNVRTVTDKHAYACELNAYYPYGALMNTLSGNGTRQPYKYGGKELDRTAGLDLYDSQARFYDPVLGRTTTVDPKSAAYAGTSHYAWCAGNPVRFVDPDGRDEWEINEDGEIVKHITTTENDSFFIVDSDGNRQDNKQLVLPYKSVKKAYTKKEDHGVNYDTYQVKGDENSTLLFEFLATNTSVEWSETKAGVAGKEGLNFITSSHKNDTEHGLTDLFKHQLIFGYTVRIVNHSHPQNTPYPSGLFPDKKGKYSGDVIFAQGVEKLLGYKPKFNVFIPKTGSYISFKGSSKPSDFGL